MRALRVDKMTYAALEATLQPHAAGRPLDVPVMRMIAASPGELEARAARLLATLTGGELSATIVDGVSTIGGGSAPGSEIPTRLVQLTHRSLTAAALEQRLRSLDPPLIARIENDRVVLDLRTVLPSQDVVVATLFQRLI
jgi:L-seryl-tRNA(Ser) seleniumtransferase